MTGTRYSLEIQPKIPSQLDRLPELANDLYYSWDSQVRSLFVRLDPPLWHNCGHIPNVFLRQVDQRLLEKASQDSIYLQDYRRVLSAYDSYIKEKNKREVEQYLHPEKDLVAYFCAEFGLHESFPIYSGGLGILAGDHCKAASDLSVPFIAVGLMYRKGYFHQTIDGSGKQVAHYFETDPQDLPISPALDANKNPLFVNVDLPGRNIKLKVWQAKAGHITLYLLDSEVEENSEHDRGITHQLYGGDKTTRLQQEIVLGIGGAKAVRALGLNPTVWHINEGHAAFQLLERCRIEVQNGLDFDSAIELIASGTVFTTHTPVPAGHDIFTHELILEYFSDFIKELNIDTTKFLSLGAFPGDSQAFNMTSLALRGTRFHNGVSKIHGTVASSMEGYVWPQIPAKENPISYVTNGVHVPTFLAREWVNMFDMHFGAGWRNELLNEAFWENLETLPDHSFWSVRKSQKSYLFEYAKKCATQQYTRNGCSESQITRMTKHLNSSENDILTVGFARRFATYKRATLLFSDPERLARIVNNADRPIMFIFAGKAHPSDHPGQELLKTITEFSHRPEFEGKIILLEGYDLTLARILVSSVDVWLNTPEYPLEASGTSGEKAGINGVINLSVLDGWWGEGYTGDNGWAISPHGPQFDQDFRDTQEANELLDLLEYKIAPKYYDRNVHGYSPDWVSMSKASMKTIIPRFNSQRMVMDYVKKFYRKAKTQSAILSKNKNKPAIDLAKWKSKVHASWDNVKIRRIDEPLPSIQSGESMPLEIAVKLDQLKASDVVVECMVGTAGQSGDSFVTHNCHKLEAAGTNDKGETIFKTDLSSPLPGLQHYKIRIYPYNNLLNHHFEMGYMSWL